MLSLELSGYYLCYLILKDVQVNRTPHLACILLFIIHNVGLFPQFQFFLVHSAQNLVVKLLLMQTYLSYCYTEATLFSDNGNLDRVQRGSFVHTVFEALHLLFVYFYLGQLVFASAAYCFTSLKKVEAFVLCLNTVSIVFNKPALMVSSSSTLYVVLN